MRFANREHAGRLLAAALRALGAHRPVVLAVPRGGIAVGAPVARGLACALDVLLVRKLRHPHQPELAIGAVGEDDAEHVAPWALRSIPADALAEERADRRAELRRRAQAYRVVCPAVDVRARDAIVVDDGVATGQTLALALRIVRQRKPSRLIAAVPVASRESLSQLDAAADEVVCLASPEDFRAVGQQYDDFAPVTEDDVLHLLREHASAGSG